MSSWESYETIWKKGIFPLLNHYCDNIKGISLREKPETLKNIIWDCYESFNVQCRNYMSGDVKKLDRHKVTACYMFAVLKSEPFIYTMSQNNDRINVSIEQVAISVGLAILRSFLLSEKDRNDEVKTEKKLKHDRAIFKNGFLFPDSSVVGHGVYRDNFAIELYFTRIENNYNILSLSHSLYMLEMYNRMNWKLKQNNN